MKFSKKLLLAAVCAASALGNVSAMPKNVTDFLDKQFDSKNQFYVDCVKTANATIAGFNSGKFNVEILFGVIAYNCIIQAKKVADVQPSVKVACVMKMLENTLIPTVKGALESNKLNSKDEMVRDAIVKDGFAGNRICGQMLTLCCEDKALRAVVIDWSRFYAEEFQALLDKEPEVKVVTEIAVEPKIALGELPKVVSIAWFTSAKDAIAAPDFDLKKAKELAQTALAAKIENNDGVTQKMVTELQALIKGLPTDSARQNFIGWINFIAMQNGDKAQLNALRVGENAVGNKFRALLFQIGLNPEDEIS
jgi:hypothetical protein